MHLLPPPQSCTLAAVLYGPGLLVLRCLAEGCDVGSTTRGNYDTPASRPDGDFLWGGGGLTVMEGEKHKKELLQKKKRVLNVVEKREIKNRFKSRRKQKLTWHIYKKKWVSSRVQSNEHNLLQPSCIQMFHFNKCRDIVLKNRLKMKDTSTNITRVKFDSKSATLFIYFCSCNSDIIKVRMHLILATYQMKYSVSPFCEICEKSEFYYF